MPLRFARDPFFLIFVAALAGAATFACTPVYQYEVVSMHVSPDEAAAIEARVEALLEREGFEVFRARGDAPPLRHTGLHDCVVANGQHVEMVAVDVSGWVKDPPGVSVQQLRCKGKPWFYVSRNQSYGPTALSEVERIRDLLNEEFAPELANGTLQFDDGELLNIE